MNVNLTQCQRDVTLDIETIACDPQDEKGALSALTGRIVCICLLIDDGSQITEKCLIDLDEKRILQRFWAEVAPHDSFIGYNALCFDLPFIRQRSWILGVKPSRNIDLRRFYTQDLYDCMEVFSHWGATKHPKLDDVAQAMGLGGKTGKGSDVAGWWAQADHRKIAEYCAADVRLTYQLYRRLLYQPIPERFTRLLPIPQVIAELVPVTVEAASE